MSRLKYSARVLILKVLSSTKPLESSWADAIANCEVPAETAAVKFRISNTVLKVGDQYTTAPVFASDDSRLLPELPQGISITSNEIKDLKLEAGHFTSIVAQDHTYKDSISSYEPITERGLRDANFVGGVYSWTPEFTTSLYYSKVEDYWKKLYANVNWTHALSDDQSLAVDFNIYSTKSDGSES
jgi:imipenem/basic amino acid-specific outer membrane pore